MSLKQSKHLSNEFKVKGKKFVRFLLNDEKRFRLLNTRCIVEYPLGGAMLTEGETVEEMPFHTLTIYLSSRF